MRYLEIFIILFFLLFSSVYAQSCYDSDNGLNYYTKGYVKFDNTTYYDNCVDEQTLIEGYCDNGYFKTVTYYCPEGCENGACTRLATISEENKSSITSGGLPPVAVFTKSAQEVNVDEPVYFNASASFDSDGEIVSYEWDFDDGTTGSGVAISHSWSFGGDYVVTLTVTDNEGLSGSASTIITVLGPTTTSTSTTSTSTTTTTTIPRDSSYLTLNPDMLGKFYTNETEKTHPYNGWIIEWQFWKRDEVHQPNAGWAKFESGRFTINAHVDEMPGGDVLYAAIKQFEKGFNWNPNSDYWQWESFRAGNYPNSEVVMYDANVLTNNPLYPGYNGIIDLVFKVPSTYKGVTAKRLVLVDLYFHLNGPCVVDDVCFQGPCNIEDYEDTDPEKTIYHKQFHFSNFMKLKDILIEVMNEAEGCDFHFNWQDAELVEVTWGVEIFDPYPWTVGPCDMTGSVDFFGILRSCRSIGFSCDKYHPCCSPYNCVDGICLFSSPIRGGPEGCPVLRAWDGKEFKDIERLNVHSKEGIDTQYSTQFKMKPFDKNLYKIILQEKWYLLWEGSHIDYVSLKDSTGKECKLIKAIHSKLGDITSLLQKSDDSRVETKPGQSIELTFEGCSGNDFTFEIEGYNPWGTLGLWRWSFPVKMALSYTSVLAVIITLAILFTVIFAMRRLMK